MCLGVGYMCREGTVKLTRFWFVRASRSCRLLNVEPVKGEQGKSKPGIQTERSGCICEANQTGFRMPRSFDSTCERYRRLEARRVTSREVILGALS